MVGFCGCFSSPQVQYREYSGLGDVPRRVAPDPAANPVGAQQVRAAGAVLPTYKPAVVKPPSNLRASAPELGSLLHHSQHNQLLTPKATPSAAAAAAVEDTTPAGGPNLASHRITISPVERSAHSPDSLSAADTVRQDNADTPKGHAAVAAVSFSELLAKQAAADGQPAAPHPTADLAAGADVAAKHSRHAAAESKASQKHSKMPGGSSGPAKVMRTPPSNRKTSAGGALTPVHHTPRSMVLASTPSPAVARPTCASMSRAQAVAASMPAAAAAGHWKL